MERESATNQSRLAWMIGGAALGALAMFMSDPDRGRRRRALTTDKIRSAVARTGDAIDVASRDLGNRVQGLRARASRVLSRRDIAVDDQILTARVRRKIGRAVSNPHAIDVTARHGYIVLSGPVLAHEKQQLLDTVRSVHGIRGLEDRLQVHERANGIPGLQGRAMSGVPATQGRWPPALRAVALIGAGALGMAGLQRRTPANMLFAAASLVLMLRSISNRPFKRLAKISRDWQAIDLHKTIHIEASPEAVFDLWSKYENFPRFMSNVREVRDLGNGRSHWVVSGPAGVQVEWEADITESRRPEALAWRSAPDATVRNSGTIHFEPDGTGTRVGVHLSYSPPAGIVGHAIASLFNGDPKRQMDEDLMRMKTFIETGHVPHDAAQPGPQTTATLH